MSIGNRHRPADPGLQPERTSIAWTRTSTALIAVGLIGTRLHQGSLPILVSLAGLIAGGLLMLASSRRGAGTVRGLRADQVDPPLNLAITMTLLCLALNAAAAVMIVQDFGY